MRDKWKTSARLAPPVLPKDRWVGGTFVEADGNELEIVWDGTRGQELCGEWETYPDRQDAVLRLRASK